MTTGGEVPAPEPTPKVVALDELLQGARRLAILHDGRRYLLQLTRQNRLILTIDPSQPSPDDPPR